MKYRVVIPCAGTGSRLGSVSKNLNKALVSVSNKPAISYIIEKFRKDVEIVIALGYKKETLKEFIELAYPDRHFIFIDVDKYEGAGSGLGYSLLKCRDHLQCPFIFISNDTIVTDNIPEPDQNWAGYANVEDVSQYRSFRLDENGFIKEVCPKGATGDVKAYIGVSGVKDYKIFWDSMHDGIIKGSIENGESYGLSFLTERSFKAFKFDWYDVGNPDSLKITREYFNRNIESPNILEKDGEAIWFVENKVIKYSADRKFIENRIKRVNYISGFVPEITGSSNEMYAYKKVEGEIFSKYPYVERFASFLNKMDEFWIKRKLSVEDERNFRKICLDFYRDKTFKRIKQYSDRFDYKDSEETINGRKVPKLIELLEKVDWNDISEGIAVRFHGDLHFENVLITNDTEKPFVLLDWRQDFGGILEYGDIYYDLAKINHGLIVCHELINQNLFNIKAAGKDIKFELMRKHNLVLCENYLKEYAKSHGYDNRKIEIITALIYLNIAPLHHYPYTLLLYYLGKSMLYDLVK